VCWYLDRPVSHSGRLRGVLLDEGRAFGWPWSVEVVYNPDRELIEAGEVVLSSDSAVLDRCDKWSAVSVALMKQAAPSAWVVNLEHQHPNNE
jgi:hypothetical protein